MLMELGLFLMTHAPHEILKETEHSFLWMPWKGKDFVFGKGPHKTQWKSQRE